MVPVDPAMPSPREARVAARIESDHVVQILDYGIHEEQPFIAMELLEGQTLKKRISGKPLPLDEIHGRVQGGW